MLRNVTVVLAVVAICLSLAASASAQESRRVVLILVSTPGCGCNEEVEGFASAVARAKEVLRNRAAQSGDSFAAVGVALTSDPEEGFNYLVRGITQVGRIDLGPWDEVSAGNGWHSEFAVQRIWGGDLPARFPQLLVLERRYTTTEAGIRYGPERILHRLEGGEAIMEWVAGGANIP